MDLTLDGIVHVGDDYWPVSGGPGQDGNAWYNAAKSDLGDLIMPEPMTMALLGLGGLFLRHRK